MRPFVSALSLALCSTFAAAQVHYYDDGRPWRQRASSGPDQVVDGWYYNLGVTGIRVELVADAPTHMVVRHVFDGSPADGKVRVGDHIVVAGGWGFFEEHRNGYGMKVFGPYGPIYDFAQALQKALAGKEKDKGRLSLTLERDGDKREVRLKLPAEHGDYAATYPHDCKKSAALLDDMLDWLLEQQQDNGAFGSPPDNLFAPLAMLSSGKPKCDKPAIAPRNSTRGRRRPRGTAR